MKKLLLAACIALVAMGGCRSVSSVTNSITGTNDSLLAQVSEDKLSKVDEARFELSVAEENVKLAELKKQLADYEHKRSVNELKLAKINREHREIEVDLAKAEAIRAADLSDPVEGVKEINGYKQELLGNDSNRIEMEAAISQDKLRIDNLKQQIAEQEQHIAALTHQPVASSQSTSVDPGIAPAGESSAPASKSVKSDKEVSLPDYLKVEDDPDVSSSGGNGNGVDEGALPE
ncbi:hypothetical protein [Salidesulfovibrio onnuriiensis]|uniref:hypothetical protein n=1 Tax=Salidesulfovibrio onnuriiensis TaxID=2583823 RepID=UPI0011CCB391|nr:hypothetical protein [Salidesulfovibrio onnuriiensis]